MPVSLALHGDVTIEKDPAAVAGSVAQWLMAQSRTAIALRGRFSIALAGGTTPELAYKALARNKDTAWVSWHVFFGDERACPADDPNSNYAMARSTLLEHVAIPEDQVYRMHGDDSDLSAAARAYSEVLVRSVGSADGVPILDCVLLGLGENGHTASLFPGDPSLLVDNTWCTTGRADYEPYDRLTMTFPCINAARHVAFIVTGDNKRQALADVVAGTAPAARVTPHSGFLRWFLDSAADG